MENFFRPDGRTFHEICFFYEVIWTGPEEIVPREPAMREIFQWARREEVAGLDMRPRCVKKCLEQPATALGHLVQQG